MLQNETNQLIKKKTQAKKMKMFIILTENEHLNDKSKELLQKLSHNLFGNQLLLSGYLYFVTSCFNNVSLSVSPLIMFVFHFLL